MKLREIIASNYFKKWFKNYYTSEYKKEFDAYIYVIDIVKMLDDIVNGRLTLTKEHYSVLQLIAKCGGALATSRRVITTNLGDEHVRKFIIHHELGHIVHGDTKVNMLSYIKNSIHMLIKKEPYLIDNDEIEVKADNFAMKCVGYKICAVALAKFATDIVATVIGTNTNDYDTMLNYMVDYLNNESKRFISK